MLQHEHGSWINELEELEAMVVDYYKNTFSSNHANHEVW